MGLIVGIVFLVLKACAIAGFLVLQESSEPHIPPVSTPLPSINNGRYVIPVSSSHNRTVNISPIQHTPLKAPSMHKVSSSYNNTPHLDSSFVPTPPTKFSPPPSLSPLYPSPPGPKSKPMHYPAPSVHKSPPPDSSFKLTSPTESHPAPSLSPLFSHPPMSKQKHYSPPPQNKASSAHNAPSSYNHAPPFDPSYKNTSPTKTYIPSSQSPLYPPRLGLALPPSHPSVSPAISPSATSVQTSNCSLVTCKEPLTNTPPGMPCNCVMPMQIALGLGVALYAFFPLVSKLAFEIASGVNMKPSQVRIMGANADDQDPEKTVVLIDLVPFGENFDDFIAHLTAQ